MVATSDAAAEAFRQAGIVSGSRVDYGVQPRDVVVYVMNKTGYLLKCPNGKMTTAEEVKQKMMKILQIDPLYDPVFAMWMTSPCLQLQLKPFHHPSKIKKEWKARVAKLTTASVLDIKKDEPLLSFQRSAFLPVDIEQKITNPQVVGLLYDEAVQNVIKYKYPITKEQCFRLAAMQAVIKFGPYDSTTHDIQFLKEKIDSFIPSHFRQTTWWQSFRNGWDYKDLEAAGLLLSYYRETAGEAIQLMKHYLSECQALPYYGSVFFYGQIEQEHSLVGMKPDRRVRIAINYTHLHVIDIHTNEIVIAVPLEEISWDYRKCCKSGDHCFSSFFIEFDCEWLGCDKKICHQLQIYSRQAAMMDAFVDRCANKLGREDVEKMVRRLEAEFVEQGIAGQGRGHPGLTRGASIHHQLISKVKVDRLDDNGMPLIIKQSSIRRKGQPQRQDQL